MAQTSVRARVQRTLLLALLILAPAIAKAQVDDQALIAAAKKEGLGTIYTGATPASSDRVVQAFAEKYGIHLDQERANSGPLTVRFNTEWQTDNVHADVIITSDELFAKDAARQGRLGPIGDMPETRIWPAGMVSERFFPIDAGAYPLIWNTNLVPKGLKGWADLLDPSLKGKVMISDPRVVTTANGFFITLRRKYGDDFLRKLGQQAGGVSPSAIPGLQQVAAGAYAVYAPGVYPAYVELKAKGAPLDFTLADPVIGSSFVAGWVTKAPHPNVAKLVVRYLMTREGQAVYNKGSFTMLPGTPDTIALPNMTVVSGEEILRERPELMKLLDLN